MGNASRAIENQGLIAGFPHPRRFGSGRTVNSANGLRINDHMTTATASVILAAMLR